jgi:threonine dehydratase
VVRERSAPGDVEARSGRKPASTVACAACGFEAGPEDPYPFRCRDAGTDDADHVMVRSLDPRLVRFPVPDDSDGDPDPFVRYRDLFHAHHLGLAAGMSDEAHVRTIRELDDAVAAVDGRGFEVTPFARSDGLSDELGYSATGGVWVKDETGNVSGSHKARHLMGLMAHLRVVESIGGSDDLPRDLAIASCGNAALGAAVVARAAGRRLLVFVPEWADAAVVARLRELGAVVEPCPRRPGVPGDPAYHRLHEAMDEGAIPFTCQGPDNGLTIEGGETLGYELVSHLMATGERLDRIVVQVGGGALATSIIRGYEDAIELGADVEFPTIDTVQTRGAWPLRRAWQRFAHRVLVAAGHHEPESFPDRELAELLQHPSATDQVQDELAEARRHRSAFMWPWEQEPRSLASGILDDETYDWAAVLEGMVRTGGIPLVVDEPTIAEANERARLTTGIAVDHTGSAGLAGLLAMRRSGEAEADERVAVLFTGVRRESPQTEREG